MKKIILLRKKEGKTPLETLESFRAKYKVYKDMPMTYAGRLDPLASGLLVVLTGEALKEKEKYLKLSKEYRFEVLFGFSTDTFDILGKVTSPNMQKNYEMFLAKEDLEKRIKANLKFFTGKLEQRYPMYSSKTVAGKPLFTYARAGRTVESPLHEVNVRSLKFIKTRKISAENFLGNIERRIAKVKGDFRQKEILKIWRKLLSGFKNSKRKFFVASFEMKCDSGTYVRSVANDLGEKLGVPSIALSIKRTKIGRWS